MINYIFLSHLCCVFAIIVWNASIQNKEKEKILYFQFLSNMLYGMSYFILGAPVAGIMDSLGGLRCFVFYYKTKKGKKISIWWLFLFCSLAIILGVLTYNGIISLIPTIICIFYTVSAWIKDTNCLRIVFILAAFLWIYYNFKVGAFIAIIGNVLEIISGLISIYRFRKKDKAEV